MKVDIIGAGFLGLSTGIILSKNGYDVNIFERKGYIGGRFIPFANKDLCDAGVEHNIVSLNYIKKYRDSLFKNINFEKIDIYKIINFNDKSSVEVRCGYDNIKKLFYSLANSRHDINIVNEIFDGINLLKTNKSTNKIKSSSNMFAKIILSFSSEEKKVKIYRRKTVDDFLSIIEGDKLKELIKSLANKKASFMYLLNFLYRLSYEELFLCEESMSFVVNNLKMQFETLGGKLHLNQDINEVYIGVQGTMIKSGEKSDESKVVVIATDNIKSVLGMVDDQYINQEVEKLLSNGEIFDSYLIINFTLLDDKCEFSRINRFVIEKPFIDNAESFQRKYEAIYKNIDAVPTYSIYMRGNYSYWKKMNDLKRSDIEHNKNIIANKVKAEINKNFEGFDKCVKSVNILTPFDKFEENKIIIGSTRGWISTPKYYDKKIELIYKNSKVFAPRIVFDNSSLLEKSLNNVEYIVDSMTK